MPKRVVEQYYNGEVSINVTDNRFTVETKDMTKLQLSQLQTLIGEILGVDVFVYQAPIPVNLEIAKPPSPKPMIMEMG